MTPHRALAQPKPTFSRSLNKLAARLDSDKTELGKQTCVVSPAHLIVLVELRIRALTYDELIDARFEQPGRSAITPMILHLLLVIRLVGRVG